MGGGEAGQAAPGSAIASPAKGASEQPSLGPPAQFLQPPGSRQLLGHAGGGWNTLGKGLAGEAPWLRSHQLPQEPGLQGGFQRLA